MDESTTSTTSTGDTGASAPGSTSAPADNRPTSVSASLDASFAQDLAGGEPATPQPAATIPEATTPAPATTEPPLVDPAAVADTAGPIPFERHKAALENARTKAREEASQQFQQQYGPAIKEMQRLGADLQNGSIEGWAQLTAEYAQHPVLGQQVRSFFGRMLGQRGQAPQGQPPVPAADQEPSYFVEQNGERYFDPEKFAAWQQWNKQQLKAEMQQEFKPLVDATTKAAQVEAYEQVKAQSWEKVNGIYDRWKTVPGFVEHQKAIAAKQKELFESGVPFEQSLGIAYAQVVPALLQAKSTNDFITQATAKSRASTANPVASAPARPGRFRTPDEAINAAFEGVNR